MRHHAQTGLGMQWAKPGFLAWGNSLMVKALGLSAAKVALLIVIVSTTATGSDRRYFVLILAAGPLLGVFLLLFIRADAEKPVTGKSRERVHTT